MHLLIPFASGLSEGALQVMRRLELPNLARLLQRLAPTARDEAPEYTLSPPHERALAALRGWRGADGALPFAAHAAAADGVATGALAWGLLTPVHGHVGREHVTLGDPAHLDLPVDESRALFDSVRRLFESEGFVLAWGAADRWYAAHEGFDGFPAASLDRVVGRNVDFWMNDVVAAAGAPNGGAEARRAFARLVRRLQSESQLLLYAHPVNEAREARRAPTVNSLWLSGCGRPQPDAGAAFEVDASLRAPGVVGDWAAWGDAWRALDAGALAALADAARQGDGATLTLCGERAAQRFDDRGRSWLARASSAWQKPPSAYATLEAL